ncbi:hypothetical protein CS022_10500 [Veronia nyctiphanis]|uniref:Uncharacterized protein n=1 Tax=Veronia nyctiphanis TaxID=1278244 RepID=A0A4Q0YQ92_9GAMM|nr:hypothetical protein [Veronia nyctiphanis]RXJ73182.1 hypothetical protein CS022_10500 [Veronia nyctiphanis]
MERLAERLIQQGFNVKVRGAKAIVNLGGLSNPVAIKQDLASNQYIMDTHDLPLGILYTLILTTNLYGGLSSFNFFAAVMIGLCVLGFTSLLMTELKARRLRECLDTENTERLGEPT